MEHAHVVRAAVVDQRNGAACAQDAVDAYFCTVGRFDLQVVKRRRVVRYFAVLQWMG